MNFLARFTIGFGAVALIGFAESTNALPMQPLILTGFNRDLVVESTASGPPFTTAAYTFNPGEGKTFYQKGLPGKNSGLPTNRSFTSVNDSETVFLFQPFTNNNALLLSSDTAVSSGTLVLSNPAVFTRIAILANSAGGGGTPSMTLNFSDGTSFTTSYNAPDWFGNSGYALLGTERISLNSGSTEGGTSNPRFYQTSVDLSGNLKVLVSITFNQAAGAGATAIWAISGEAAPSIPVVITRDPSNVAVDESYPANFSVLAAGNPAPGYQWYRNGILISGATNSSYTINSTTMADNAALFRVVASNVISNKTLSVTSAVASLTVRADTTPPVLLGAQSAGLTNVIARFSERITLSTATNLTNYTLFGPSGSVSILNAAFDASQSNVVLRVSALTDRAAYSLRVSSLTDVSSGHNVIAPNSQASFYASQFVPATLGDGVPGLIVADQDGGLSISSGGLGLGSTSDQSQMAYVPQSGDFDRKVRLDSLGLASAWSQAGIIVREDLSEGARFASAIATPTISGSFFKYRSQANAAAISTGGCPVNYPNTWLRIKRSGNTLTGFAGFDGLNWTQLGQIDITLPTSVYLGFFSSSHDTNSLTTAVFKDFGTVTNAGTNAPLTREPLSQCTRRTSLVISEIMYHPTNSNLEFVEIFNTRGEPQDMGDYQLGGSVNYRFPADTVIPGGGFLVVANFPEALQNIYGINGVLGPFANNLPNDEGTVELINQAGAVLLQVDYQDGAPWPVAADGSGHSMVLAHSSYGENKPQAWEASDSIGGSPGRLDSITFDPCQSIRINEFLAHADSPGQFVELYNYGNQSVDISGCSLSNDPDLTPFIIPPGTVLGPRALIAFSRAQLGFTLDGAGDTIYLRSAVSKRVLDVIRFEAQQKNRSYGRFPDGAQNWTPLATLSAGQTNGAAYYPPIVINEIMYDPISLNDDDQFIELYNRSSAPLRLDGWQFTSGITYTFGTNTIIPAGGYIVVARNVTRLSTNYSNLNPANLVGSFSGSLSHKGETVALSMPETFVSTNSKGNLTTNTIYPVENQVTYGSGGRWPELPHGGGSSLELIDPRSDNSLAPNWAESDETHKSTWTSVSATGTLDNGTYGSFADQLHILLQDAGECLVDDVQVLDPYGANLITNSTFEVDASGWTAEGTESLSSLETTEGYNSSRSLHIRAVKRGDNQVNRVRIAVTPAQPSGATNVTIRAKVRWLKGHPEILLRLRGNWLECVGQMKLPLNLGSPGAPNSRYLGNVGPAVTKVMHSPVLPQANEPIVITAQVNDPDGISSVVVQYRLDPSPNYMSLSLKDDGSGKDSVAGDGIFTGTIPAQASGTMVAYYVQATDRLSATTAFPNNAPARECLVRVGEVQPVGNFPVYRLWMTQATLNSWANRNEMDNSPFDVTFVLGNQRVFYNSEALYAGSPYIAPGYSSPVNGRCGYSIEMPSDDLFLGEQDLVVDWPGGHGGETTALQEQMGYWIAEKMNMPFSHRYTIRLHVNGVTDESRKATFEAYMQPAGGFLKQWSPSDSDGQLFKIERAFDCNDSGGLAADPQPRLENYTSGGAKKLARYRWNWLVRSADRMNDLTNIYSLVDAVNSSQPTPYETATEGLVDVDEWMRIFAIEHIIVNFDAYGHAIGKNMYAYLPQNGKWQLYMCDLDWLMLAAQVNVPNQYSADRASLFVCEDPTISRMYAYPAFARCYWRAIQDAISGPMLAANSSPVMDAKYNSLVDNGVAWCDGQALTDPSQVKLWFSQRRSFLITQLGNVDAPFSVISTVAQTNGTALVSGTSPISAEKIRINGAEYPILWTTVSNWVAVVPVKSGSNSLSIVGVDRQGNQVAGATNQTSLTYNSPIGSPVGQIVFNEVMWNPDQPNAQYVEFYNNSTNVYDLSGWQVKGLGYTFPSGSLIGPTGFVVLAANRATFAAEYGALIPVLDTLDAPLLGTQKLSLIIPHGNGTNDLVVAQLQYQNTQPWPITPLGQSLQLIDSRQDNWRVGNWSVGDPTPGAANKNQGSLPRFASLWINEVQAENTGGITNSLGQRVSWIEIYNPTTNTVVMTNLYLANSVTNLTRSAFPTGAVINPGQFRVVFTDGLTNLTATNEWHANLTLSAGSGSVYLSRLNNGQPQILDFVAYTNLVANHSYGSYPDGQSFERRELLIVTPGTTNNGDYPLTLRINEWMAGNTKTIQDPLDAYKYDDWFELYNYGSNTVSLEGCYMTNSLNVNFDIMVPVPAGYTIPPKGTLLVWADKKTPTGSGDFHANFKLNKGGSTISLYDPNRNLIDFVTFGAQTSDISMGLYPDGSTNVVYMVVATPRANNLYNTAPAFAPMGNVVLTVGQTLNATPQALDVDIPLQTLVFNLEPGSPTDAVINPLTGVTTWTATNAETYTFTIKATDNGIPAASAVQSFTVTVYPRPGITSAQHAGDKIVFTWASHAGQDFQIESKNDLNESVWTPVGTVIGGVDGLIMTTNDLSRSSQFFRVRVLP